MNKNDMRQKAVQLLEGVTSLPTIPEVAFKVQQLLNDPDVNLDQVADIILADAVLAARVIKVVNSPLFRPTMEINSVKRALVHLGLYHVKDIVLTCSIIKAFESKGEGAFDLKSFWEHSFGVGVVARIIAQQVNYRNVEKAYIVGIIHDLGQVFLANHLSSDFGRIAERLREHPGRLIDAEQEIIGTSHCDIGAVLADKWNFPPEYKDVLAHHHTPYDATIDSALVAIINLADMFCSVRGLGLENVDNYVTFNLAEEGSWNILKTFYPDLNDLDVEKFCYELDDKVPGIKELVLSVFDSATGAA